MSAIYELSKSKNDKFYFNLKAANGLIILTSEMYETKANALKGIESVKSNSYEITRFNKETSSNGKFYFNLVAKNGQIIGSSEMYESEAAATNGMESVKNNGPTATVVDKTIS